MTKVFQNINDAIEYSRSKLYYLGYKYNPTRWQAVGFSKEEMAEILNLSFAVKMPETVEELQEAMPHVDLPWAEEQFKERISGAVNPGETYKIWPYYNFDQDEKFLKQGKFSHTYMERYWPRKTCSNPRGIRYEFGDLHDLMGLLATEPDTRQAYLPVWFPEDTGAVHGERVPCTLGYHFINRGGATHCNYYIRSCDLYRHFRNDIYMTIRLAQHINNNLELNGHNYKMGFLTMHITSFHIFMNDWYHEKKRGTIKK